METRLTRVKAGLGPQASEITACWQRAEATWDLAMLALRAGTSPQVLITTTPRRVAVLRRILAEATTVQTTDTTFANEAYLPKPFLEQIVGLYANTKLGRQEIYAEFLDTTDGVWFARFDPARHVSVQAEYDPIYHVRCAIDAGTSRHTAAVFFQDQLPGRQPSRGRPDRRAARRHPRRLPRWPGAAAQFHARPCFEAAGVSTREFMGILKTACRAEPSAGYPLSRKWLQPFQSVASPKLSPGQ